MSKNTITLSLALLISMVSFAQLHGGFNYKALIKDANGNIMTNHNLILKFELFELGHEEFPLYAETHTTSTDANGIVVVVIGEGDVINGDFSTLAWGYFNPSLKTEIDLEPYDDYVLLGITPFKAVPYAKISELAATAIFANNVSTKIDDLSDGKSDDNGSSLFIGKNAGLNDDGSFNRNVGIGSEALISNISGHSNVANGVDALKDNSSGFENTAIGIAALKYNIDGKENTAIGGGALLNNKGDRNIAIGKYAGRYNNEGSDNIFIGFESGSPSAANNRLYINNGASINPLIYGEFDTNLVRINGTFDVTEEINREATGDANLVPIAYGTISSTGDILSGTGNFTVDTTNAPTLYINVTGANLSHSNSSASVTPLSGAFRTASISHSNGNLRVHIFNSSATQVANTFQFIVYKL